MLSILKSMSLNGLDGFIINIQVDISAGMPAFEIVGLPDIILKESRERIRTAIKNSGFDFLSRKIIVNLAPANIKKGGSFFDLPIALGVLLSSEQINEKLIEKEKLNETAFIGELSLNGKINPIQGILPMCIEAKKLGLKRIILPIENSKEASIVDGIEIYGVESLFQVVEFLIGETKVERVKSEWKELLKNEKNNKLDFSEVKGQENVKRAIEIAASGGHNILLIGSPGSGKTMIAKRIPTILPDLTFEESLEITKIHSISGELKKEEPIILTRPFRSPHHTISRVSLVGGGSVPKPGEISLAHFGVLFLDELPEFNRNTLEVLRGPLEDGEITISRINAQLTYPCQFMLVASMNPCPCGYYGSPIKECICSESEIQRYMGRVSGPLLDRIDIQVEVMPVKYDKFDNDEVETSESIKDRVNKARNIQNERYLQDQIFSNSELTPKLIEKYCKLDLESKKIMKIAFEKLGLSARGHNRILKVARTIADLDGKENIESKHIAEAIQYRSLDKKYFK